MSVSSYSKFAAALIAALLLLPASDAQAGGNKCFGECYEDLHEPGYFRTLKRRETLRRGVYEIRRQPAVYGWVTRRVLVSSGRSWKDHGKPRYKYVRKRVLLKPYKNIAVHHKGRHRFVRERVYIQPERSGWDHFSHGSSKDW